MVKMQKKVVVTGLGALAPNGNSVDHFGLQLNLVLAESLLLPILMHQIIGYQ